MVGAEADEMASIRLGPTRDIVTLTAMGHRLRRDGKKADAIRAYRAALLIAASTARSTLGKPVFRADSTSNRYHLPHSTLLDAIARDMDDAGGLDRRRVDRGDPRVWTIAPGRRRCASSQAPRRG